MKKYQIIYADPPWSYTKGVYQDCNRPVRVLSEQYISMRKSDINDLPIKNITDNDCVLFLWVTDSHLPDGLEIIKSWGFKYKTVGFIWVKRSNNYKLLANIGSWTMKNAEICLLATKGAMTKYKKRNNVFQVLEAPRTKHSKKPYEIRNRIVQLFGDLPRIELFAREKTKGWDVWGDEVKSNIRLKLRGNK